MAMSLMNTSEIIQALTPLVEAFDRFGIAYYIGGSVASSVHGRRRYTQDVDVVAEIQLKHVQTLVATLQQYYYIDAGMIRGAIQNRSSFNILHNDTGVKVDVFIQKTDPFSQQEMRRAREDVLEVGSRPFFFASADFSAPPPTPLREIESSLQTMLNNLPSNAQNLSENEIHYISPKHLFWREPDWLGIHRCFYNKICKTSAKACESAPELLNRNNCALCSS